MINTVTISGRLGRDIELKKTQTGKSYISFQLASFAGRKQNNEYKTEWIECEAWERTADNLSKYKKGDVITVQGVIQNDSYKSTDGRNKSKTYIVIRSFEAPKKTTEKYQSQQSTQQNAQTQNYQQNYEPNYIDNEDLPF